MDNQAILTKAITKAIEGGWKPTWVGYEDGYFKDDEHHWPLVWQAKREPYISFKWESLIFNHDFAKSLWGDEDDVDTCEVVDMFEGDPSYKFIEAWQYHLQNMVVSDDPIAYLGENI